MTRGSRGRFLSAAFVLPYIALSTLAARAATKRPNAIDLRIDHLSVYDLLSRSAAALVDPDRQIAALRLVHWYLPGWLLAVLVPSAVLLYFWNSGRAARVRDFLRHRVGHEALVRFYFGAMIGAIVRVAGLLPALYIYRIERVMSLSDQLLRAWALDWLLGSIVTMIALGLVTAVVLGLAARTHQWYIYTIVGIVALSFAFGYAAPFVAAPAFDRIVPLPPAARAVALRAERDANIHVPLLEEVRERTHLETAYVIGIGPTQRIVLGDSVFAVASPNELRYIIARQLGFVDDGSTWKIALTDALLLVFGIAIAVGAADRIRFRRDDDPISRLALVGAMLGVLYLIAVPVDNAVLRAIAARADGYALALHVDRAAAVRSVIRGTDERLDEVCPDILARLFIDRRVDASSRVSAINGVPSTCP